MGAAAFDPLSTLAFGSLSGTYAKLGSALTHSWREFKVTNDTNGDMIVSLDGTTDHMFVPAFSFTLYDLSTNGIPPPQSSGMVLKLGTQFWIKTSSTATEGAVWLEGIYEVGS